MSHTARIQNLSVILPTNSKPLMPVENVDFVLKSRETLALVGESGSGKSMTALACMRLLPMHMQYGLHSAIYLDKQNVLELPEYLMRTLRGRKIAMIFQEPMTALNPVLTIGQQIQEALLVQQKLSKKALKSRVLQLLTDVELPDPTLRIDQYPHQLSGGQKQRVVIAMALANQPDILIADEPTTALDVTIQAQILQLLKKLQHEYAMSLLLITHDLGVVKAMADIICVMYAGQIVEKNTVSDFFKQPLHPYSQKLLASLPPLHSKPHRLPVILGQVPPLNELPSGCRFHPRCAHAQPACTLSEPVLQATDEQAVRCCLYPKIDLSSPLTVLEPSTRAATLALGTEPLLTVKNLTIHYRIQQSWLKKHRMTAVQQVSFSIPKGKTLALVGESGCGKTTVARAILRLIPITSGQIDYRGENVLDLKGKALRDYRKKVQIIFQDPYASLNPRMTVGDIIAEGMIAHHVPRKIIEKKQAELLDQVHLPASSLSRYPHQFSGGQRQRISIARALAVEPELLICDEPTSALDISVQAQILNLLKALQDTLRVSYLFISHNMAVVSYMADEVFIMQHGRCVERGSCIEIFNHPQQAYTRRLLESALTV